MLLVPVSTLCLIVLTFPDLPHTRDVLLFMDHLTSAIDNFSDLRSCINFGACWGGEGVIELAARKAMFPGSRRPASLDDDDAF